MSSRNLRSLRFATALIAAALAAPTAAAPLSFQQAINTSAPILYYQLNEVAGNAINHGSLGATFDATYNGTIQRAVPTPAGDTGAIFDDINDYLESLTTSPAALSGNPTFTAETLVAIRCTPNTNFYPPFLHWGQGTTSQEVFFSLRANDSNKAYVGFYNGGLTTQDPTPIGEWMHLVWVRQGGGNAATGTTLYLNGQSVALTVDNSLCCATSTPAVTSAAFRVNRARDFPRFTTMEMDELALYDRAISAPEVTAHFAALTVQSAVRGDLDCDQFVTGADVDGFVTALLAPASYPAKYPLCNALNGDFNGSGTVTTADIPPFVARLTNFPTTPFQQAILDDSPALFYSMNQSGGPVPNRGSLGAAYDAIRTGSTPLVPSPNGDGGLYFPGSGNYLLSAADAPAAFTGNPSFSLEAVVKPTCTVSAYTSILGWGPAGNGTETFFGFPINQGNQFFAGFFGGGSVTSSPTPHAQWFHVVWTRAAGGNVSTGSLLYIDGQPAAIAPDAGLCCNTVIPNVGSTQFRINATSAGAAWYFIGSIDEVALYDHILTPAQVTTHYNALPH